MGRFKRQQIGMPSLGPGGQHVPAQAALKALDFYFFDNPNAPATTTVSQRLAELEKILQAAEMRFS